MLNKLLLGFISNVICRVRLGSIVVNIWKGMSSNLAQLGGFKMVRKSHIGDLKGSL